MSDHVVLPWLVPVALLVIFRALRAPESAAGGDRRFTVVLAIAAFVAGAWQLERAVLPLWRAHEARSWPSTVGTVVYSQVETTRRGGRRSDLRRDYYANVGTQFSAGGAVDTTWRVGLTRGADRPEVARAVAARYPVGAQVTVFYDPARPWAAVLEREAQGVSPVRGAVGLALALGALVLLASGRERRHAGVPTAVA